MRTLIKNGILVDNGTCVTGFSVVLNGKIIEAVVPQEEFVLADIVIDAEGRYVSPGFIELHTHGIDGYDFMDNDYQGIKRAMKAYAKHGVTGVYPTTLACPMEELISVLDGFSHYREEAEGAVILGVHLEGPYFSPLQCGAQDTASMLTPKQSEYCEILSKYPFIKRWDLAPELEGGNEMIQYLKKHGVVAGIAHTDLNANGVLEAAELGATVATHLYSGMSAVHREHGFRHGGTVEGCLVCDTMFAELICDGIHLPSELIQLALRAKGQERLCIVTDSMRGADMPEGSECRLGNCHTGQNTVIEHGVAWLPDKSAFAGSIVTMDKAINVARTLGNLTLPEAVFMATVTPAQVMGLKNKGRLQAGFDADVVIFDENIHISQVIIEGKSYCF